MVELLKQDQYVPMPVEEQIFVLYIGTKGHLDDVDVEVIGKFEAEFLRFIRDQEADLLKELAEKLDIDDDIDARMAKVVEKFKETFQAYGQA